MSTCFNKSSCVSAVGVAKRYTAAPKRGVTGQSDKSTTKIVEAHGSQTACANEHLTIRGSAEKYYIKKASVVPRNLCYRKLPITGSSSFVPLCRMQLAIV
jgi:hypothetical protein